MNLLVQGISGVGALVLVQRPLIVAQDLLLPQLDIPLDAPLRIHLLQAPLPPQMQLPLLAAVALSSLILGEEIVSAQWLHFRRIQKSQSPSTQLHLSLHSGVLPQIPFNALLGKLIIALPVFALVVWNEVKMATLGTRLRSMLEALPLYGDR